MRRLSKKMCTAIIITGIVTILYLSRIETSEWPEIHQQKDLIARLQTENEELKRILSSPVPASVMSACETGASKQLQRAQDSQQVSHEWELAPASLFTSDRVFPAEPGSGGRVVEKIMTVRREDLVLVVSEAIKLLHQQTNLYSSYRFSREDFVEGNFRSEPALGVQYELIFRNKTNHESKYIKLYLQRPYAPISFISTEENIEKKQLIHVILPLAGRVTSFKGFMERFYKVSQYDGNLLLTVVYFGTDHLNETQSILTKYQVNGNPRIIVLNEPFSRAKALRIGATHWSNPQDELLFFCDVDIVFTFHFLERCRWNTSPGVQVYYPIVFSLYNPRVVYEMHGRPVPPENEQLIVSKRTGFWRDFGFGMTCQYRSDFLRVFERGFERTSWGGEDVELYRKFLRDPRVRVFRATDSDIFHLWHGKRCDAKVMSPSQLRACLHSRARNEASHSQLGLLAFNDQNYNWRQ